jgi:hypothetical protein
MSNNSDLLNPKRFDQVGNEGGGVEDQQRGQFREAVVHLPDDGEHIYVPDH